MRRLLRFKELRDHGVIIGRRQLDRLEARGLFPRRVPVGANSVGWVETEIDAYVDAKIKERSNKLGQLGSAKENPGVGPGH